MEFQELVKRVEESEEFKSFIKDKKNVILAHIFVMMDEENKDSYQVGYYNKDDEKMTTFLVKPETITSMQETEILKLPGTEILELKIEEVHLSGQDALDAAQEVKDEEYPGIPVLKTFFIIQNSSIGQVFNITYFTRDLKTINFKLSTMTGELLDHSCASLVDMQEGTRKKA